MLERELAATSFNGKRATALPFRDTGIVNSNWPGADTAERRSMMSTRLSFRQPLIAVALAVLAVTALGGLHYLDHRVAQAGLWLFLGLALTTGFFHGTLDIILIQGEFASMRTMARAIGLYAGSAILIAIVCAHSGRLLLLMLLVMSVWHFGEPYGRWAQGRWDQRAWIQRIVAGGAPVMLPALLSPDALRAVLPMAVAIDAATGFAIWQALAWIWVGLGGLGLAVFRQRFLNKPLLVEVSVVFAMNLLLSPLMAFSIYFGVIHSTAHIVRVVTRHRDRTAIEKRYGRHGVRSQVTYLAIAATTLATVLLLLLLIRYLQAMPVSPGNHHTLLNGVVVALTSLTLPHLVLISRNAGWLTGQSGSDRTPAATECAVDNVRDGALDGTQHIPPSDS